MNLIMRICMVDASVYLWYACHHEDVVAFREKVIGIIVLLSTFLAGTVDCCNTVLFNNNWPLCFIT